MNNIIQTLNIINVFQPIFIVSTNNPTYLVLLIPTKSFPTQKILPRKKSGYIPLLIYFNANLNAIDFILSLIFILYFLVHFLSFYLLFRLFSLILTNLIFI